MPFALPREQDDQAAVELVEHLERAVRDDPVCLARIEELGERRRDNDTLLFVQDQPAGQQRKVVPQVIEDAGIAVNPQRAARARTIAPVHGTERLRPLQAGKQIVKAVASSRMDRIWHDGSFNRSTGYRQSRLDLSARPFSNLRKTL